MTPRQTAAPVTLERFGDPRALAKRFRRNRPFEHLVFDGFTNEGIGSELLTELPPPGSMLSGGGSRGRRFYLRDVAALGPSFKALDGFLRCAALLKWLRRITGHKSLIPNPRGDCGGLFYDECGMELAPHIDVNCTVPGRRRAATLLLYLNARWRPDWGGMLELSRGSGTPAKKEIPPSFNRCVLMASHENSWHGYRAIRTPPGGPRGRWVLISNYYRLKRAKDTPPHYNVNRCYETGTI